MSSRYLVMIALLLTIQGSRAALVNRWSFNEAAGNAATGTVYTDPVTGTPITVRGNGALLDGSRITLPGTTNSGTAEPSISAYLDLPNGVISAKTHLTVEIWAAPVTARFYQPLFDFGRMNIAGDGMGAPGEWTGNTAASVPTSETSDGLSLLVNRESNLNTQRQGSRINGGTPLYLDSNLATVAGTTYHYVFTFENTVSGGTVSWYRNGVLIASGAVTFHLSDLEDVNNWLGRSQWNVLSNANVAYDEVRIYNHALSPAEVSASLLAGQDASFTPPVLQPDSATLHHAQKVRLSVLANDEPGANPTTVEIVQAPAHGTAVPDANGRILYTHTSGSPATDSFTYRANSAGGFTLPVPVTLNFATGLRIQNTALNVPAEPPETTFTLPNAFGSLTFSQPINVATAPGDAQRLFVVERQGNIRVIPDVTAVAPTSSVFLNLAALMTSRGDLLGVTVDRGLMSVAFHPQYAANGYFYVFYCVRVGSVHYYRIARFTRSAGNPDVADPATELVLIQQQDDNGFHLGTDMHFGPDGYLYVSTGDGGGQADSRGNGQVIDRDFFCAVLRLDVDKQPGNPEPNVHASVPRDGGIARYSVPATNPYVTANPTVPYNGGNLDATTVRTEFFANGFRNPWRFSFDPVTGELWLGDVGQVTREEVNLVTLGGNYGWAYREGSVAGPRNWGQPVGFVGVNPLYEYGNPNGDPGNYNRSITGGIVYRGSNIPTLTGAYLYADYMTGDIFSLTRDGAAVNVERITGEGGIVAFGADPSNGDALLVDISNGMVRRLVQSTDDSSFPQTLSDTGLFAEVSSLSPAPGLLPYTPNLSFWSDHALKRRWFIVPEMLNTMTWTREGAWTYPDGTVWVKHFDLETTRGNPATARRIETRLLVKNATGSYGVSYRWNEAQTEATLVADAGEDLDLDIIEEGIPRVQHYRIPSRSQCVSCHNPQAGHALSFNTRQLNRTGDMNGFNGNQIHLLHQAGYFNNTPESPNVLPRHLRPEETSFTLEARVRSYLAVNCANCHQAGGPVASPTWDARAELTLAETLLINGAAINNGGNPANRLIVSGDPSHSIVLNRIAVTNGFTRMPPLGSNELDQAGIALLTEWIASALPSRQSYDQWREIVFGNLVSPEGSSGFDADVDSKTNGEEFLAGTGPLSGSSLLIPQLTAPGSNVALTFDLPAHRSFQVDISTDLQNWTPWDVPGNAGLPHPGGTAILNGPRLGDRQFFRLRLWEN